jgi:hypothetical protein
MKKIFTLALLTALTLAGCNPNNEPQTPQPEPCDKHDVDLILNGVAGIYYGKGEESESNNYFLLLSSHDRAFDMVSGTIAYKPNSHYLWLDLYSLIPSANRNLSFKTPNGVYTFDSESTTAANTCGAEYTEMMVTDDDSAMTEVYFTNGTITVTDSLIDVMLLCDDGKMYHVQSPNKLVDNIASYGTVDVEFEQSTLTEDLDVLFERPTIYASNWGDYNAVGKDFWRIYLDDDADYQEIMLMLHAEPGMTFPVGTYPISGDISNSVALYGYADGSKNPSGCWYLAFNEGWKEAIDLAALKSGSVTIVDNNDGTYTVSVNAKDILDNTISATCSAAPKMDESSSLSTLSTAAKMVNIKRPLASHLIKPMVFAKR